MKIELLKSQNIPLSKLETNNGQIDGLPKNPRFIKTEKFQKLKKSIEDNPEMLGMREVLVYPHAAKFIIIGGNMRFIACKELGFTEVPCKVIDKDTTAEQLRAITIKDNVGFGEHDWDLLANEWDSIELDDFGLDVKDYRIENNEVIDTDVDLEFAEELTIGQQFLIITFEDDNEYEEIKNLLKLKQVIENNLEKKHLNNKGTERVIKYKEFIKKYDNSNTVI